MESYEEKWGKLWDFEGKLRGQNLDPEFCTIYFEKTEKGKRKRFVS